MKQETLQLNNDVIKLFNEGKTAQEIADIVGKSRSYVYDIASHNNLKFNLRSKRHDKDILMLKNQGLTALEISETLSMPLMTVYDKVYKAGLPSFNTKRRINSNPFNNNDLISQYIIGLWATDGNVHSSYSSVSLSLIDEDIIAKISNWLGINYYTHTTSTSTRYVISFGNKEVKDFFISVGVTPNKSRSLKLKCKITPLMFRGIMDGDGSYFYKRYNSRLTRQIKLISASKVFAYQCSDFLSSNGIINSVYEDFSSNGKLQTCTHYRLNVSVSDNNDKKLYDLLYSDLPDFCIKRKKEIFSKLVQVKFREFRESLEAGNSEPSLSGNTFEGATTNSRVLTGNAEDSNANTSAEQQIVKSVDDIV